MTKAEVPHIRDEVVGDFCVAQEGATFSTHPRAQMHFVNADWSVDSICLPSLLRPAFEIGAARASTVYYGGGSGRTFLPESAGIGLLRQKQAVGPKQFKFIIRANGHSGDENLPNPSAVAAAHGVTAAVPVVEIADDTDPRRVRRPHGKSNALHPVDHTRLGAQYFIELDVITFGKKLKVDLVDYRRKAVRIFGFPLLPALAKAEAIGEFPLAWHRCSKEPRRMDAGEIGYPLTRSGEHLDAFCLGCEDAQR